MDKFTTAYLVAALWSSTDENEDYLDSRLTVADLPADVIEKAQADCAKFQAENAADLQGEDLELAGHDFWLTRNGHGAGFWDGDYEKLKGERLTKASTLFGECYDLYGL